MTVISQSLKSELECHKNNSLVAQRRKKKQRKKVKGKFRLVTKKFPRLPAKAAALKLRESARLFQSPLISGPGTGAYFLIDTLYFVFISFFVKKRSVRLQISLCHSCPFLLNTDCEDGRGPTPRWECGKRTREEIPDKQAIAGVLRNSGSGAASVSHLHLPALPYFSGKMHDRALRFHQLIPMAAPTAANGYLEMLWCQTSWVLFIFSSQWL